MKTIAISGKGGTGKSTVAALVIRWLNEHRSGSILAVDADSNVNLNEILGVKISNTVGAIREEMKKCVNNLPSGMTKQQFLEYKIQTSLAETRCFDLIAMGRPEGPGCYCYANNLLRDILNTLGENYEYVVIDNEAGMEHLSRRTTQTIDYLLSVSDASPRGIQTAVRISKLLEELDTRVRTRFLVLNRAPETLTESVRSVIEQEKLHLLGIIPEDTNLLKMDRDGTPVFNISLNSSAYQAVDQIMNKLDF
jgi:CO dehydrogenase maturation factor